VAQQHRQVDENVEVYISPEILSKINTEELLQLIRQLPPSAKAVFNLYIMEGYSHKEIGSLLSISEGTSKWHLSEARKKLQQMIQQQDVKHS
jgi:RNA polymerase sigma-70 factor (ECF subfamily)